MSSSTPVPPNVFKILPEQPPSPLPSTGLPASSLDSNDGFIHTSTASVIPRTSDLFFAEANQIWILKLSTEKLVEKGADVRWEGPEGCVHIYGKGEEGLVKLDEGNIVGSKVYKRGSGMTWGEIFADKDGWLVDIDAQ